VDVKTLKIDFSDNETIYEEIEAFLNGMDIGVLVNNVGIGSPPKDFLELPDLSNHTKNLVRINIVSILKVR